MKEGLWAGFVKVGEERVDSFQQKNWWAGAARQAAIAAGVVSRRRAGWEGAGVHGPTYLLKLDAQSDSEVLIVGL